MKNKINPGLNWLVALFFLLYGVSGFSQCGSNEPCPPDMHCDEGVCVDGPPPPPGLLLPINDYLTPLLIAGIILGAHKIRKMETAA